MFRELIVGVDTRVPLKNGMLVPSINFDNAATTPPFHCVIKSIVDFAPWYSSIHRGTGYKSILSSELYEASRKAVMDFVGAGEENTVIYVKNTTEAINKLSYRLCHGIKQCRILSTDMEHHSNDLPWREKYILDYVTINFDGTLSIEDLEEKLKNYGGTVKLVTVTGASNVTGAINPIHAIARLCHRYGAKILVDGAQLVPHISFSMGNINSPEHIDFLVFSAHKMYAPFGTGVIVGPKEVFETGAPDYAGGGTVRIVTHEFVAWDDPPEKEEAGSPNVIGAVALSSSISTLKNIRMSNIEKHEKRLTEYSLKNLKALPGIKMYDNISLNQRVGIIPFNIEGIPHEITSQILADEGGISVRNGCFCAQPYVQKLLKLSDKEIQKYISDPALTRPGMVRISFGLYNEIYEIDVLLNLLEHIIKNRNKYLDIYAK